tara:strand:+ start:371 stop:1126 length:756 start_codon:yes stop_codon:yes gene_type:complete
MLFFQVLTILVQLGIPVFLFLWVLRNWKIDSKLVWAGAAAFVGSQLIHLPMNWYLGNLGLISGTGLASLLLLSFTAGLCEEPARYFVLKRWWAKAKTHKETMAFGLGHGGIESFIVGLLSVLSVVNFWTIKNTGFIPGINPEELLAAKEQIEISLAMPPWIQLAGGVERIFTMVFHFSASCLVMVSIVKKNVVFLWLSVLWHTLYNFAGLSVLVFMGGTSEMNAIIYCELVIMVLAVPAICIINSAKKILN